MRRKLRMSWRETREFLALVQGLLDIAPVTLETHELGLEFAERYGLSIYNSMIRGGGAERLCTSLVPGHAGRKADQYGVAGGESVPMTGDAVRCSRRHGSFVLPR